MLRAKRVFQLAFFLLGTITLSALGGCGLYVPQKRFLSNDAADPTRQGALENALVGHIKCEIEKGLYRVATTTIPTKIQNVPWLYQNISYLDKSKTPPKKTNGEWGTSVNLTIQVDEQSGLSPSVSLTKTLENSVSIFPVGGNVVNAQNFSLGFGASATAHATRTETIQFTYGNPQLLDTAIIRFRNDPANPSCDKDANGVMINSDLKIDQFIYDKAIIASFGNDISVHPDWPPYNTFQDQITFTASFGGSVTPVWKFARVSVDQNTTLFSATRDEIDTLIITLGPVDTTAPPNEISPLALKGGAQTQHAAAAGGVATAGSEKAAGASGGM